MKKQAQGTQTSSSITEIRSDVPTSIGENLSGSTKSRVTTQGGITRGPDKFSDGS